MASDVVVEGSPRCSGPPSGARSFSPRSTQQFLRKVLRRSCSHEAPCLLCQKDGGSQGPTSAHSSPQLFRRDESQKHVEIEATSSAPSSPQLARRTGRLAARSSEATLLRRVRTTVPRLGYHLGKAEGGGIAVFGGFGAAYFTAISALRCGAEAVHVFCEREAGPVMRGYSPELVVHPVLDQEYGLEEIQHWLPRLQAVVVGPGLGRNLGMAGRLSILLEKVRACNLPVVLDADALWHLALHPSMLRGHSRAVVTPNSQEFSQLTQGVLHKKVAPSLFPDPRAVSELARALGHVTVVAKGAHDVISDGQSTEHCSAGGSPRRCAGQGDLLGGLLATFLSWSSLDKTPTSPSSSVVASWAACRLARESAAQAFAARGRSMAAEDMVAVLHSQFKGLFERETFLTEC